MLLEQAQKCFTTQQYDEAMRLIDQIEVLPADTDIDTPTRMKVLSLKGLVYSQRRDHKNAERYMLQSLVLAQSLGEPRAISIRYENLAGFYMQMKEHQKATTAMQHAIELKEQMGNMTELSRCLLMQASIQFGMEHNDAGMASLRKAEVILKREGIQGMHQILYFNTAMYLKRQGRPTAAIREYGKCITEAKRYNDYLTATKAANNQGDICITDGQWSKAKKYYEQCIEYALLSNMPFYIMVSRLQLARIALQQKKVATCRALFDEVTILAQSSDDPMLHRDLAELAMQLHEAEGNYKAAAEASRTYVKYYRVFYDNEMSRAILDMKGKYETEKAERELQKARLKQAESELKALRAQMDPHFIFNALSSMRREMLEGNLENADRYLVRFSKLLRMILDTTRQPMVRLSDNIELLHLYIQIENSRQGNRFDYSIDTRGIDPATIQIPGLLLQPLAENAIVHGLNPKKNGRGKLQIQFSKNGSTLRIKVTDNGVGRKAGKEKNTGHTSHAMNIIRETLALMWQDKGKADFFTIKDLKTDNNIGKGTEVTVLVPLPA